MEKFASILSAIPMDGFQNYILSLDLSPTDYTLFVALFALMVSLVAFGRAGSGRIKGSFSSVDALQARLDKVELSLADVRHRYAHALSQLEMEVKSTQHDIAELRKMLEIVLSSKRSNGTTATRGDDYDGHTAVEYEDYRRTPATSQMPIHTRGAPLDVRLSQAQEGFGGYKK